MGSEMCIRDRHKVESKELYKNLLYTGRNNSITVSIRMSKELYNSLKEMAEIHGISLNRLINLACIGLVIGGKVEIPKEKPIAPPIVITVHQAERKVDERARAKARVIEAKVNISLKKADALLADYGKLMKYKDRLRGRMDFWQAIGKLKGQLSEIAKDLEKLLEEAIKATVSEETLRRLEEYLTAIYKALGEEAV